MFEPMPPLQRSQSLPMTPTSDAEVSAKSIRLKYYGSLPNLKKDLTQQTDPRMRSIQQRIFSPVKKTTSSDDCQFDFDEIDSKLVKN